LCPWYYQARAEAGGNRREFHDGTGDKQF